MGTSLNGLTPAGTYPGLIKTGDNAPIDGTLKTLSDGNGNNLPMSVSTTTINLTGTAQVGGVAIANTTQVDSKTAKLIVINRQTSSYSLVLSDADKLVEMNVASANNLTVPPNSSVAFSTGTQIILAQYGAGQTTIVAGSGVTIRSNGGKLKLNAQYSGATLIKIASDEWYLFGDIA